MRYLYAFLCFSIIILAIGCQNNGVKNTATYAKILGEIVNPKSNYVTILDSNRNFDTIYLDEYNRFSKTIDSSLSKIFWVLHSSESQLFFLEPGDSLLFRINTIEFDETLTFSGTGSAKNNLLVNNFLVNETSNLLIRKSRNSTSRQFMRVSDSIHNKRLQELDKVLKKNALSNKFMSFAKAGIDYQYYYQNEQYVYLQHKYKGSGTIEHAFVNYRKDIELDKKELSDYYAYFRAIDIYLKNISAEKCALKNPDLDCYDYDKLSNLHHLIQTTDSLLHIEKLRNRFIKRLGRDAILLSVTPEEIKMTKKVLFDSKLTPANDQFFEELSKKP